MRNAECGLRNTNYKSRPSADLSDDLSTDLSTEAYLLCQHFLAKADLSAVA